MDERNINAFLDRLIADFNSVIRQAEEVLKEETVEFNYKSKCYGNIKK